MKNNCILCFDTLTGMGARATYGEARKIKREEGFDTLTGMGARATRISGHKIRFYYVSTPLRVWAHVQLENLFLTQKEVKFRHPYGYGRTCNRPGSQSEKEFECFDTLTGMGARATKSLSMLTGCFAKFRHPYGYGRTCNRS